MGDHYGARLGLKRLRPTAATANAIAKAEPIRAK
jgi:hypothetical protein